MYLIYSEGYDSFSPEFLVETEAEAIQFTTENPIFDYHKVPVLTSNERSMDAYSSDAYPTVGYTPKAYPYTWKSWEEKPLPYVTKLPHLIRACAKTKKEAIALAKKAKKETWG